MYGVNKGNSMNEILAELGVRVKKLEDKIHEAEIRTDEQKRIRAFIFNVVTVAISFVCMVVTIFMAIK